MQIFAVGMPAVRRLDLRAAGSFARHIEARHILIASGNRSKTHCGFHSRAIFCACPLCSGLRALRLDRASCGPPLRLEPQQGKTTGDCLEPDHESR
jgi:hypothetical protein